MGNVSSKMLEEFLHSLILNEKSENTVLKYGRDIKSFIRWCSENEVHLCTSYEISKDVLLKYKTYLKEKYIKVSTINSKISSINAFLKFSNLQNLKIKIIKCQKSIFGSKNNELTKSELRKLLDTAYKKRDKRIYYLMLTIARTGIRVSEVKYITCEAIKDGKAIVDNKGKVRTVIIPRKLCKILTDYCKCRGIKSGSIFITRNGKPIDRKNIWHEMKTLCELSGVDGKKVFPHNLRHLFAREFYKETQDIVKLSSILGHSSIETTRIYTKVTEDECRATLEKMEILRE